MYGHNHTKSVNSDIRIYQCLRWSCAEQNTIEPCFCVSLSSQTSPDARNYEGFIGAPVGGQMGGVISIILQANQANQGRFYSATGANTLS